MNGTFLPHLDPKRTERTSKTVMTDTDITCFSAAAESEDLPLGVSAEGASRKSLCKGARASPACDCLIIVPRCPTSLQCEAGTGHRVLRAQPSRWRPGAPSAVSAPASPASSPGERAACLRGWVSVPRRAGATSSSGSEGLLVETPCFLSGVFWSSGSSELCPEAPPDPGTPNSPVVFTSARPWTLMPLSPVPSIVHGSSTPDLGEGGHGPTPPPRLLGTHMGSNTCSKGHATRTEFVSPTQPPVLHLGTWRPHLSGVQSQCAAFSEAPPCLPHPCLRGTC